MNVLLCWLVGLLFAAGVYLLICKNLMRILFGIMLLGSSINLLIFTVGRVTFDAPAFINPGDILGKTLANALPQALILTAIVIGFGLMTFALVLITRVWQVIGTMNSDEMNLAEQQESLEEVES